MSRSCVHMVTTVVGERTRRLALKARSGGLATMLTLAMTVMLAPMASANPLGQDLSAERAVWRAELLAAPASLPGSASEVLPITQFAGQILLPSHDEALIAGLSVTNAVSGVHPGTHHGSYTVLLGQPGDLESYVRLYAASEADYFESVLALGRPPACSSAASYCAYRSSGDPSGAGGAPNSESFFDLTIAGMPAIVQHQFTPFGVGEVWQAYWYDAASASSQSIMVTGSIAERLGAPVLGPENNQAAQKLAGFAERLIPVTLGAN